MRSTSRAKAIGLLALAVGMAANFVLADTADVKVVSPNSSAYGKTLTEWFGAYWQWYYSGAYPAQGTVGHVQLMPLPNATQVSGSWTPDDPAVLVGQLEITLPPGTPFVLPAFSWIRERYVGYPTVPDDPIMTDEVFVGSIHPLMTIDGQVVLSEANKAEFYVPTTAFDPMIEYATPTAYNSVAALSYQTEGVVCAPLASGQHVIQLYESVILEPGAYSYFPDGYGVVYTNTWTITVSRK